MTPDSLAASSKALSGPVVLITGASQGIGEAIAEVFAREVPGVRLALVARQTEKLAAVAEHCRIVMHAAAAHTHLAGTANPFTCDVTEGPAVRALGDAVHKQLGPVDVLINNAGVFAAAPFLSTSLEDFDRLIAANLRSAFLVSQVFVPAMVARGRGDVFFMSSIAGLAPYPGGAAYCAAKFGVTGLAQVLRAETRAAGVRVCCVHPGATWSPSWSGSGVDPERIMPAADVARAFLDIYRLSRNTVVEEIVLRPQRGDL